MFIDPVVVARQPSSSQRFVRSVRDAFRVLLLLSRHGRMTLILPPWILHLGGRKAATTAADG